MQDQNPVPPLPRNAVEDPLVQIWPIYNQQLKASLLEVRTIGEGK